MSDDDQQRPPLPASPQPAVGQLRASDADRERVADQLRQASGEGRLTVDELDERLNRCYAAKTVAELAQLTADVIPGQATTAAAAPAGTVSIRPGPGGTGTIVSIMGGNDRAGRWRVASRLNVLNVMGGSDLDLTQAELSDSETTITVFSLMGGSDLRVPDGVEVHVTKFALMGGHDVKLSDAPVPPGAPVIKVRLFSIMGGGELRQGRKLSKAERRLEQARERGELSGG
ncbi:MAG TPA: DUF1707 domain-containing protein [Solirubrobacteraceae bacterium]|jgi:uncharacterized protein DUF1707/cell wall-active antibiotic response 4TMS protein YvqF|nr:DUF1707 domain-containing protein [Solirubrobacteraceae bacterium]